MIVLILLALAADFTYRESDPIPGATLVDKLKHISQRDLLDVTKADSARCGPAAILNAYLLLGGDWPKIATHLGVQRPFTFENIHLAQEAIYNHANRDGKPGVFGGYLPDWDPSSGRYLGWKHKPTDEAHHIFEYLGLDHFPIYGPTKDSISNKGPAIESALKAEPKTVFVIGVNEAFNEAVSNPVRFGEVANHYTLVFQDKGKFYMLDPWAKIGDYALRSFDAEQTRLMLFETYNPIIAVQLKR
jgi:hypothetical protein